MVSGQQFYLTRKNKITTNWNCSKKQTHKCRATATTKGENFIQTRGAQNHDISTAKFNDRLVLKKIKGMSESNIPTVTVATVIQPIADDLANQLALPTKENVVRTAQLRIGPTSLPLTRSFEIPKLFTSSVRFDSEQYDHGKMILLGDPERLKRLSTLLYTC